MMIFLFIKIIVKVPITNSNLNIFLFMNKVIAEIRIVNIFFIK